MDSVPENMKGYIQRPFSYYIIGGEQIYKKALDMCHDLNLSYSINATEIYLTKEQEKVPQEQDTVSKYACDTFFPKIDESLIITSVSPFYKSKSDLLYRFITYEKTKNSDTINIKPKSFYTQENDYLDLMRNILENGSSNDDRTGVGTVSIFGSMLKYDLRDTFPLCTTKRMFFRAIFEELMFYLSGKTDNKILQAKGIHVWDGNTSREFLDKRGLAHYEEGDMGQTYGFNYRHFGGEYKGDPDKAFIVLAKNIVKAYTLTLNNKGCFKKKEINDMLKGIRELKTNCENAKKDEMAWAIQKDICAQYPPLYKYIK